MPLRITRAGERARTCAPPAHTSIGTGRATASQEWHWIIPPGTCRLGIPQDTSLARHHPKDTPRLLDP